MTKHLLHHEMTRGSKAADLKRIRIHDLRHSHATMLVEMGMSVPSIAARLGHSGETATHRYLHLLLGSEAAIAGKFDADLIWITRTASDEYAAMAGTELSKDANEAMGDMERCC